MNAPLPVHAPASAAPSTAPSIRTAEAGDVPAILAIYAHHVQFGRASFEEQVPTLAEMERRFADVGRQGLPYLVAQRDGVVLGYAYASAYRTRSGYRFTIEDSIYIDHRRAGAGLGRALLQELLVRCERGPWRQMVAVVASTASGEGAGSIALHEKMGFRVIGRLEAVGFKHGQWIDTLLMQRPLGAGNVGLPGAG